MGILIKWFDVMYQDGGFDRSKYLPNSLKTNYRYRSISVTSKSFRIKVFRRRKLLLRSLRKQSSLKVVESISKDFFPHITFLIKPFAFWNFNRSSSYQSDRDMYLMRVEFRPFYFVGFGWGKKKKNRLLYSGCE